MGAGGGSVAAGGACSGGAVDCEAGDGPVRRRPTFFLFDEDFRATDLRSLDFRSCDAGFVRWDDLAAFFVERLRFTRASASRTAFRAFARAFLASLSSFFADRRASFASLRRFLASCARLVAAFTLLSASASVLCALFSAAAWDGPSFEELVLFIGAASYRSQVSTVHGKIFAGRPALRR
jgi:hypothetical protein